MKDSNEEYVDCGILLKQISDRIENHSNKQLQKINLTATQFRYLEYMSRSVDPVPFKDVEKHFQTSQPTVSGNMRRLAEKDLIVIEDGSFGRAKNARLTEKGWKLMKEAGDDRGNEERMILSALKEEEREEFHDMLERINKNLSE
ncbi:MAG: MarR family winged helix-turn-helix transcriptional regulator [Oscillospiraceae bacterium]|jgi:DNA-binding MarR family transcriptional regulator